MDEGLNLSPEYCKQRALILTDKAYLCISAAESCHKAGKQDMETMWLSKAAKLFGQRHKYL